VLKRNVGKLRGEVEGIGKGDADGVVEKRVEFLGSWVVPKCYGAFNAVIADGRYAPLGLMLLGTLARLQKTIAPLINDGEGKSSINATDHGHGLVMDVDEDIGEVISRNALEADVSREETKDEAEEKEAEISSAKRKGKRVKKERVRKFDDIMEEQTPSKPPKKKRKKKGDAFDDLFDSLM